MLEAISTEKAPQAIGPYSQAIAANGFIFASGQIPINPVTGAIAYHDIEAQTRQVLDNLKNVLEAAGSSLSKVVKTTLFIMNMKDFPKINEIYSTYFNLPYPARSTVEVSNLPKDVLIEIEAIAVK